MVRRGEGDGQGSWELKERQQPLDELLTVYIIVYSSVIKVLQSYTVSVFLVTIPYSLNL